MRDAEALQHGLLTGRGLVGLPVLLRPSDGRHVEGSHIPPALLLRGVKQGGAHIGVVLHCHVQRVHELGGHAAATKHLVDRPVFLVLLFGGALHLDVRVVGTRRSGCRLLQTLSQRPLRLVVKCIHPNVVFGDVAVTRGVGVHSRGSLGVQLGRGSSSLGVQLGRGSSGLGVQLGSSSSSSVHRSRSRSGEMSAHSSNDSRRGIGVQLRRRR